MNLLLKYKDKLVSFGLLPIIITLIGIHFFPTTAMLGIGLAISIAGLLYDVLRLKGLNFFLLQGTIGIGICFLLRLFTGYDYIPKNSLTPSLEFMLLICAFIHVTAPEIYRNFLRKFHLNFTSSYLLEAKIIVIFSSVHLIVLFFLYNKLIRIDFDPEILENYRIDPSERLQTQEQRQFEPLDVTKIDLADMEKKGIRMEDIEPHLKAMSYGHKSNGLVEMNPELENGMRVSTKGRVSLEEQADGSLRVVPHYWQERPDLDAPFHGVLLDEEAKTNLMNTRHAGKVIDLELEPGKLTPCYVSIDKWTNTLEPMPVSLLEKRARIKEADLSEGKQMDFYGGGKVLLEGYTTRAGYKRDAYIQIDAAERNYSFTYDGLDRNRYAQENKEIYRQKAAEKNGRQETTASERQPTLTIHRTILKASVPKEAYDQWTEAVNDPSKRADVKAFYIKGMVKDGQGEPFNAWVKPNFERNKMDFFRWNPDRAKRQGAEVKPAVESRTQVAVNSEGKTVEAVKGVKEPLKQGQQEATPTQKKNYRSSKKSNSKGVKV